MESHLSGTIRRQVCSLRPRGQSPLTTRTHTLPCKLTESLSDYKIGFYLYSKKGCYEKASQRQARARHTPHTLPRTPI